MTVATPQVSSAPPPPPPPPLPWSLPALMSLFALPSLMHRKHNPHK